MKTKAKKAISSRKIRKAKAAAKAKRETESAAAFAAAQHTVDLENRVAQLEGFMRNAQKSGVNWTDLGNTLDDVVAPAH